MLQSTLFDKDTDAGEVRSALRSRLLTLPFSGFARVIGVLLEKMGYQEVSFTSRKDFRGRNGKDGASGGYDIAATLRGSGVSRRTLIQIKQFGEGRRVYQRSVDELRGACLRTGASEGLLLTLGALSRSLTRPTTASAPFAPVRLVDGEELLDLLLTHRVGVWFEEVGTERYGIDEPFFESLRRESPGNGPDMRAPGTTGDAERTPPVLVTVVVEPAGRKKKDGVRQTRYFLVS